MAKKKTVKKKSAGRAKKAASKPIKKLVAKRKPRTPRKSKPPRRRGSLEGARGAAPMRKGPGARAAGQSGDIQGLSRVEEVDSESVEELAEEGQDFEASAVSEVENARDPDEGEVTTEEVPEDDVPPEYRDTE
jgi:hypothetical protein